MKLKQLQALRAVAETGSLQGAAGRLCVTQPAVSRAIIDLESELGVPLLTRTARGALLTGFGASILKRALLIDREVGASTTPPMPSAAPPEAACASRSRPCPPPRPSSTP